MGLARVTWRGFCVAPHDWKSAPASICRPEPSLGPNARSSMAISRDGSTLAFVTAPLGSSRDFSPTMWPSNSDTRIYVRRLDTGETNLLPDTDGAFHVFFSPDGSQIGFFAQGELKKMSVTGGAPVSIRAVSNPWGPGAHLERASSNPPPLDLGRRSLPGLLLRRRGNERSGYRCSRSRGRDRGTSHHRDARHRARARVLSDRFCPCLRVEPR